MASFPWVSPPPPPPCLGCIYFVPYFLLFSLPENHFAAGNVPTQNCFKSFLEHVKIGKQNKTKNKSLLGFQTQAPCCSPRVLPDPGDRAHRTVIRHTLFSHRARVCGLGEDRGQVSPILLSFFSSYCLTSPCRGGPAGPRVVSISLASALPRRGSA